MMKYKPGQWVTLRGRIIATAEFHDAAGQSASLTLELAGPTKKEVISVDADAARPVEVSTIAHSGTVEAQELYAAALRCGLMEPEQVPDAWKGKTLRRLRELEQDWGT